MPWYLWYSVRQVQRSIVPVSVIKDFCLSIDNPFPLYVRSILERKKQHISVEFCSPSLDYSVSLKVWSTLEYTYLTRGALFLKLCFAKCSDWAIEQLLINILLIHCVHIRIRRLDIANNNNMIQGASQTERSLPWFLLIKYWAPFLYVPFPYVLKFMYIKHL